MRNHVLFGLAVLTSGGISVGLSSGLVTPAHAAQMFTQNACVRTDGACIILTSTNATPVTVRSISFRSPGRGQAMVTFHGSMTCTGTKQEAGLGLYAAQVGYISQITDSLNSEVAVDKPGGSRHQGGHVIFEDKAFTWQGTFNLHSTRVFAVPSASMRTYYFRMRRLTQTTGMNCAIYNAAFSVTFVP